MRFYGLIRIPMPDNVDAGAGRRVWIGANLDPTETVVDLGGTGNMLERLHDERLVTALDDLSGFGPGHRLYGTVHQGDIQRTPFTDHQFDVAVMAEVLEHVPRPVDAIREATRIAKRVLITTPFEHRWTNGLQWRVSGHLRFHTPDIFASFCRRAGVVGEFGLLEFGSWSFIVAVLARDGEPYDRMARQQQEQAALT